MRETRHDARKTKRKKIKWKRKELSRFVKYDFFNKDCFIAAQ